ncbi:MAG: hypothetical protein EU551_03225 [Promethearchaeota archaeon]|nr:MAG: hypothetical protein EU551_03225 [Candidatus Lokiarchaeota archaeon]
MKDNYQLNKKKFLIQIIIAIVISIFFQLIIDPLIYDPYVRGSIRILVGDAVVITSLSQWFFSFSFAYLYYRENEILENYLLCGFIPLVIIVGVELAVLGLFWDFLHIPPIIISIFIIIKRHSKIKLKYIGIISIFLMVWASIVRLLGTNYTTVAIFPEGLVVILLWPLLNLLMGAMIIYLPKKIRK